MKCAHPDCARDASENYRGGFRRGRPRASDAPGVPYCKTHYNRVAIGQGARLDAIEECAAIAEFHGAAEVAKLLRRLKS